MAETSTAARASVVSTVAAHVQTRMPGGFLVGLDGRTAAGKMTFGHELAEALARQGLIVLRASLDDFKHPWRDRHLDDRESGEGYYRNALDYESLIGLLLEPFRTGAPGEVALYSIDPITQIDHSGRRVPDPEGAALIVDGVFAIRPEINHLWDLRVRFDIDEHQSVGRGTGRDHARVGDAAAALHRDGYGVAEEIDIRETDPVSQADVVIDNRDFEQPSSSRAEAGVG